MCIDTRRKYVLSSHFICDLMQRKRSNAIALGKCNRFFLVIVLPFGWEHRVNDVFVFFRHNVDEQNIFIQFKPMPFVRKFNAKTMWPLPVEPSFYMSRIKNFEEGRIFCRNTIRLYTLSFDGLNATVEKNRRCVWFGWAGSQLRFHILNLILSSLIVENCFKQNQKL